MEMDHHIPHSDNICQLYNLHELEGERCTLFSGAPYTMRSKDTIIASIGTWGASSLLSFDIRSKDA